MRTFILIIAILAAQEAYGKTPELNRLFEKFEMEYNLPDNLLKAICSVESDFREHVVVYNDGGKGDNGYGLCQIQYGTAIHMGMHHDSRCQNRVSRYCSLLRAEVNLKYAARYLSYQLERYQGDIHKVISAYNAGTAITTNKQYVKKVLKRLKEFDHEG